MAMPAGTDTPPAAPVLVASLGPKAATFVPSHVTMLEASKRMFSDGSEAAVVFDRTGSSVKGVVTSLDVVRSVATKGWMSTFLQVAKGMSAHPNAVLMNDKAMVGIARMMTNNLGHLPVVNMEPSVTGMLSITGCLVAAIRILKREDEKVNGIDLEELTVGGILSKDAPSFVGEGESIISAAAAIAKDKKAVMVLTGTQCVGVITPGIIVQVVAEGRDFEATTVSDVMVCSFDTTPREKTVLAVLAEMRDGNIEHVVVGGEGRVAGVVSAMDIVETLAGTDGSERREAFLELMKGDDEVESTADSMEDDEAPSVQTLCVSGDISVAELTEKMAGAGTDVAIIEGSQGEMEGVLTDLDLTRKVFVESVNPVETPVCSVVNPDPASVKATDGASDSLSIMMEKHLRLLPVVNDEGIVTELLDIRSRCLYEAIRRLKGRTEPWITSGKKGLVDLLVKEPTLGDMLAEQSSVFVEEQDSVATAGNVVATSGKAVLVLNEGRLAGIVTPKDLLMGVLCKGLDAGTTLVKDVMSPNPDTVSSDMSIVEALRKMHENEYLHLPVVADSSGEVLGVAGIMEVVGATTAGDKGSDRWKASFGNARNSSDEVSDSEERGTPEAAVTESSSGASEALVMSCDRTVSEVAREMALKKADAALLTRRDRVVGIITNSDLTRCVIALDKSLQQTAVRDVMASFPAMEMMTRAMSTGVDGAREGTVEEEDSLGLVAPSSSRTGDRETPTQAIKTRRFMPRPISLGVGLAALAGVSLFFVTRSRR